MDMASCGGGFGEVKNIFMRHILKENGCDSSFLILNDESFLKNEEVMLESIRADVRAGKAPSLLSYKRLLNSVDFLKKTITISNDYFNEILENEDIAEEVKVVFRKIK